MLSLFPVSASAMYVRFARPEAVIPSIRASATLPG